MNASLQGKRERVSTLVSGAHIVTLDRDRRILADGALAIRGDRIAAVGSRRELEARFDAAEVIDGSRFVITPGFVDAHVHVTGDPLTRGYVPDDLAESFGDKLTRWVIPRFLAQLADDERLAAQLAAVQMLRFGTTCFLEAGTIRHLDAAVEGLLATGIRGRVGAWVEGRVRGSPPDQARANDEAIGVLEDELARYPASGGERIAAWPILVGHSTNTDEVWRAAKSLADANHLGVSAHMSPYETDAEWYLEHAGRRPIEHLAHIGVLGENLALAHVTHLSDREAELLRETRTNAVFCPLAAIKAAFGVSRAGRFPELCAAGVNVALGSDGDVPDLMQKMSLTAGLFKDVRGDATLFPAHEVLTMAIGGGARALQLHKEIGSLEPGKKADFVLHDIHRPEWCPLTNVLHQLVWSADGRGVHSVWVDGVRVVDDYRCTLVDEEELYRKAQAASRGLLQRSGVPARCAWPLI